MYIQPSESLHFNLWILQHFEGNNTVLTVELHVTALKQLSRKVRFVYVYLTFVNLFDTKWYILESLTIDYFVKFFLLLGNRGLYVLNNVSNDFRI